MWSASATPNSSRWTAHRLPFCGSTASCRDRPARIARGCSCCCRSKQSGRWGVSFRGGSWWVEKWALGCFRARGGGGKTPQRGAVSPWVAPRWGTAPADGERVAAAGFDRHEAKLDRERFLAAATALLSEKKAGGSS